MVACITHDSIMSYMQMKTRSATFTEPNIAVIIFHCKRRTHEPAWKMRGGASCYRNTQRSKYRRTDDSDAENIN